MTEPVKRRPGRPKGARNRPKPHVTPVPRSVEASVFPPAEGERIVSAMPALDNESWVKPWPGPVVLEPSGTPAIHVTLLMKVAMSQQGSRIEIDWPAGMPLPGMGDRVVVGEVGGYVGGIEWHPSERRIVVSLR